MSEIVGTPAENGKVGHKRPPVASQFKPGNVANPGGKPVKARNALNAKFIHALSKEFDENGAQAIRDCAKDDPGRFVSILASLLPKEFEITRPLDEVTDEQLDAAAATIRAILAAKDYRPDDSGSGEAQSPEVVPALPETV